MDFAPAIVGHASNFSNTKCILHSHNRLHSPFQHSTLCRSPNVSKIVDIKGMDLAHISGAWKRSRPWERGWAFGRETGLFSFNIIAKESLQKWVDKSTRPSLKNLMLLLVNKGIHVTIVFLGYVIIVCNVVYKRYTRTDPTGPERESRTIPLSIPIFIHNRLEIGLDSTMSNAEKVSVEYCSYAK